MSLALLTAPAREIGGGRSIIGLTPSAIKPDPPMTPQGRGMHARPTVPWP